MERKKFIAPKVLQSVSVQLERDLLGASVRLNMTVTSMGQEVKEYDFGPESEEYETYWD